MPLENRKLEPGTVLTARHKGETHTAEVVQTDEGLRYRVAEGREFKSPSAAGKAVTGGACNGWVFWSLAGEEKPKRERAKRAKKEPAAKKPARGKAAGKKSGKSKGTKKGKAHRAAAKSDASFACGVCDESFPTMAAATAHALTHTA